MISSKTRWLIWSVYAALWTFALIFPIPEEADKVAEEMLLGRKYLVAKGLHIGAYLVFTALSGWLRVPLRYRVLLIAGLMAHATATELMQMGISRRTGSVVDIGFDHLGIFLGLALSWRWWRDDSRGPSLHHEQQ